MKSDEATPAELYAAAARAGCRVEELRPGKAHITAPNGWAAARLLKELCTEDVGRPGLIQAARLLGQDLGASPIKEYVRRVFEFVKRNVRFEKEDGEIFQTPSYTVRTGVGDCDDHARIVRGLLAHAPLPSPIPTRLVFLHKEGGGPRHVLCQAFTEDGWTYLETTCDARLGEPPLVAAKRLGLIRSDIAASGLKEVRMGFWDEFGPKAFLKAFKGKAEPSKEKETMGTVVASSLTKDWSDTALRRAFALVDELGCSIEDFFAVLMNESDARSWALAGGGNKGGASGANQIMPDNFRALGIPDAGGTADERGSIYRKMSPEEQMPFIARYFSGRGRLASAGALYLANFLPADLMYANTPSFRLVEAPGVGRSRRSWAYEPNRGFDRENKGFITVQDLTNAMRAQMVKPRFKELVARAYAVTGRTPGGTLQKVGGAIIVALAVSATAASLDPTLLDDLKRIV